MNEQALAVLARANSINAILAIIESHSIYGRQQLLSMSFTELMPIVEDAIVAQAEQELRHMFRAFDTPVGQLPESRITVT